MFITHHGLLEFRRVPFGLCNVQHASDFSKVDTDSFSWLRVALLLYPGEKGHVNTWLAQALVGTARMSMEIREILIVQRLVTSKCAGASGSKINDYSISTCKQACSRRYLGSLKLSSRRFEHAHNRSVPLLTLFSIAPEVNGLGQYHAVIRAKFGVKTAYFQQ